MRGFLQVAAICGMLLIGVAQVQAAQVVVSDFTITGDRPAGMRVVRGCALRDRLNDAARNLNAPVTGVDTAGCEGYFLRGTASISSLWLSQGLQRIEFSISGELVDANGCVTSRPTGFATATWNGHDGDPYGAAGQQACCQMVRHVACYFRDRPAVYVRPAGVVIPIGGGSSRIHVVITNRPRPYYREVVRSHQTLVLGPVRINHGYYTNPNYRRHCR